MLEDNSENNCFSQPPSWIAISLSGPSLASWSIVLNYDMELHQMMEKLIRFKESVKLEKKSTAFAIFPVLSSSNYEDSSFSELTSDRNDVNTETFLKSLPTNLSKSQIFRDVFPNIPLACLYNEDILPSFCVNPVVIDNDGK